ncbi:hypothetical protein NUW54_g11301 [Trametes sanguinea]|uniref:Uncharacterized protein n=1 Tax=Trametes sanguinea TaxID=158606 RepID=A0ACC1NHA0_9APHY|nr:hypothetical protein NUW54_g11301 [Trametes sanguinea]
MSVWLPRSSTSHLVRAYSCNAPLAVRSVALASVSQNSRLALHPLYSLNPSATSARWQSTQPSTDRQLHSSSAQNNASATTSNGSGGNDKPLPPAPKEDAPLTTRIWKKVKHEAQHYWHGTKLLAAVLDGRAAMSSRSLPSCSAGTASPLAAAGLSLGVDGDGGLAPLAPVRQATVRKR